MENDKIFELMTKMYADLKQGQKKMYNELKEGQNGLKKEIHKTNLTIENDIKPKMEALFDGYKQNNDKLDKIENHILSMMNLS